MPFAETGTVPDSDVDLALVLTPGTPGDPGADWSERNYQALGGRWGTDLTAAIQHDVHLKATMPFAHSVRHILRASKNMIHM